MKFTLRELASLGTSLEIAHFQLKKMHKGPDRLLGAKCLRMAFSIARRLRSQTFTESTKAELEEQIRTMREI